MSDHSPEEDAQETPPMAVMPEGQGISPGTRTNLTRRHLFMGMSLLAVSGLAYARRPRRVYPNLSDDKFNGLFPRTFADWQTLPVSELILPPESDLVERTYQHVLTRTYTNSANDGVMFLAAYNSEQLDSVMLHRPEICYPASGFKLTLNKPTMIDIGNGLKIPARNVRAVRSSRIENILYWTRVGGDFPQSWLMQRLAMTKSNIEGYLADGLLLRMSIIENDNAKAVAKMTHFIRQMAASTGPATHEMMFHTKKV